MGALLFISTQLGAAEERPFLPGLGHEPGFFTRGHAREYRGWLARWDFRQTPDEEARQDAGVEAPWTDKDRVRRANRINGPGTGGSHRLRGIAWLNPKSKPPSEKFAMRSA